MNQESLLIVMTVFVGITALSFVAQAIASIKMAKAAGDIKKSIDAFIPKAEAALANAEKTLNDSREQISGITRRANDVLDLTKTQLVRVDSLIEDASGRARIQMDKVEVLLDDTMSRVQTTVTGVQSSIVRPLREINGVAAGVRSAVAHLLKGSPANVAQVTADEEMFI
jgi:Tfp pilus assembly protein PilX